MVELITAAMREGDWGAVLRLMHAQRQGSTAASAGVGYDLPPFYREFEDVYRQLYWCYDLCNSWGWGGALPPVALLLNRSRRWTRVAGYAKPGATAVNGRVYCAISVTLNICTRGNIDSLMTLLLHEMTHIWQFAAGRRGGHGKDFKNEMLRLGIDEARRRVRVGSTADRIFREAQMRHPGLVSRLRLCFHSPHRSTKGMDLAFFRMMLKSL